MGGNGSLIDASAHMVTVGIAERAGSPITYAFFLKKGFPALVITVALALMSLIIGSLTLSRAVHSKELSDRLLHAGREAADKLATYED